MSGRRAQSLYRGLRVSVTSQPGTEDMIVTVAVKDLSDRWDEWSLLFPAVRLRPGPDDSVDGWLEVLEVVARDLSLMRDSLS